MSVNYVNDESNEKSKNFAISTLVWAILSLLFALIFMADTVNFVTFYQKFLLVSFCIFFGTLFAQIGNALRMFAHPDGLLVSGGFFDIIKIKLFWMFVPQLIGFGIGIFFALLLATSAGITTNDLNSENQPTYRNEITNNSPSIPNSEIKVQSKEVQKISITPSITEESVSEMEQRVQYSGDDPIIRARLGLPPKN